MAALLPATWELRLADLNTQALSEADWQWADLVMISSMLIQKTGLLELVRQAKKRGKTVIAGGPYPTTWPQEVLAAGADIVGQGEAENIIKPLLQAIAESCGGSGAETREPPSHGTLPHTPI